MIDVSDANMTKCLAHALTAGNALIEAAYLGVTGADAVLAKGLPAGSAAIRAGRGNVTGNASIAVQ